jgi:hypothetical protein
VSAAENDLQALDDFKFFLEGLDGDEEMRQG